MEKKIKTKCDYCGKIIYKSSYCMTHQKNHFCNNKCQGKWRSINSIGEDSPHWKKVKVICTYCGKVVLCSLWCLKKDKMYFCNSKCYGKWRSKNLIGMNNPTWSSIKVKCRYCKEFFFRKRCKVAQNINNFCNENCYKEWIKIDANKPSWNNGSSFESYGREFNKQLREAIRDRDNHKCQNPECGIHEKECTRKLDCHHVDYNKKNNNQINLIALCHKCHLKSNHNREHWKQYYQKIQIDRKVNELEKI